MNGMDRSGADAAPAAGPSASEARYAAWAKRLKVAHEAVVDDARELRSTAIQPVDQEPEPPAAGFDMGLLFRESAAIARAEEQARLGPSSGPRADAAKRA